MLSRVNGYPRPSPEGKTPCGEFVQFHGERRREFPDWLSICRVNPGFVTLAPSPLGPKFKREAENAILMRKGVAEGNNRSRRHVPQTKALCQNAAIPDETVSAPALSPPCGPNLK